MRLSPVKQVSTVFISAVDIVRPLARPMTAFTAERPCCRATSRSAVCAVSSNGAPSPAPSGRVMAGSSGSGEGVGVIAVC